MSSTITLIPLIAALMSANQTIHYPSTGSINFSPSNDTQRALCEAYRLDPFMLQRFSPAEYATCVSLDIEEVNKFLGTKGFNARLSGGSERALYVAAMLNIRFEWPMIGDLGFLSVDGVDYPSVRFETRHGHEFSVYHLRDCAEISEVLAVTATNGDEIFMAMQEGDTVLQRFDLLEAISRWKRDERRSLRYNTVIFPMIDIDHEVDTTWLSGLQVINDASVLCEIGQAVQQTKFQMNHKGAAVESAAAMEVLDGDGSGKKEYRAFTINRPFYLWIMRKDVTTPIFAGYIDHSNWKAPVDTEDVIDRSVSSCCCIQ